MCMTTGRCDSGWAEELPPKCPPTSAQDPSGETLYRLVETDPPTAIDFQSYSARGWAVSPTTKPCQAKALSLYVSIERCNVLRKMPRFRAHRLALLVLQPGDGVLKVGQSDHVHWWPCRGQNYPSRSTVIG